MSWFGKSSAPRQLSMMDVPLVYKLGVILNDKTKDIDAKSNDIIKVIEPNKELLFLKSKLLPYGGSIFHMLAYGEPRVNSRGETVGCLQPSMFKGTMNQITAFLNDSLILQQYLRQFETQMDETLDDNGNSVCGAAFICGNSPMMNLFASIMNNERFPKCIVKNVEYFQQADGSWQPISGGKRRRRKTIRKRRSTRKRKSFGLRTK